MQTYAIREKDRKLGHHLRQPTEIPKNLPQIKSSELLTFTTNSLFSKSGFCSNLRQNDPAYRIGHAHIGVAQGKLHQFIAGMRHLRKKKYTLKPWVETLGEGLLH